MSLDVTLSGEPVTEDCICSECEHRHQRTRRPEYFSSNITHNLTGMAGEAGIYEHCWHPNKIGITKAKELIEPLTKAIEDMQRDPERFKNHNAKNGWGLYEHFLPWLKEYLAACKEHPEATVSTST